MDEHPDKHLGDAVGVAVRRLAAQAPGGPLSAARIRRTVRRRRLMIASPVAAVLAVTGILAAILVPGSRGASVAGPPTGPAASACAPLRTGAPPVWARSGFTGNAYPPFATSSTGDLVAIVFGDPLTAPPAADHNNKILWVQRDPVVSEMSVTAHLEGTDRVVTTDIPVGPSIVDMPVAGCWQLDVRIGDRHDRIALRWSAP